MQTANLTYNLSIRLTGDELEALARMANKECRDMKRQVIFSLRKMLVDDGYLYPDPSNAITASMETR